MLRTTTRNLVHSPALIRSIFNQVSTWRALKTAAVVGTLLCLFNNSFQSFSIGHIMVNYCVPFCVSFYSQATYNAGPKRQKPEDTQAD